MQDVSLNLLTREIIMSSITIDDKTLRNLLKEALIEVLQERPALLGDMITEVIEEVGLAAAIEEGKKTELVEKDQVLKALE